MKLLGKSLLVSWILFLAATATLAQVRLVGSGQPYQGRLEVYHNGQWGTVCDDLFDNVDATVACKSLGSGLTGRSLGNRYGPGTGRIWLDNLRCSGSESYIGDCSHLGWGINYCSHREDVSIACYPAISSTNGSCGRQVRCSDGKCIPRIYHCNGFVDCADGSDEQHCFCNVSTQYQCDNGVCIYRGYVCNRYRQCSDGSDERHCPCNANQFSCGSGTCVLSTARCDRRLDCADGSDETNCMCTAGEFRCSNGQCIPSCKQCDGILDCIDHSDELNCTCPDNQFRCGNGQCISACKRCDGRRDCIDNSDETNCSHCASTDFHCANGVQCIRPCARCDGVYDCRDSSDELNCNCSSGQFQCDNGQCIAWPKRCDVRVDCLDRSDERGCPCRPDQFECVDGSCLHQRQRCDGVTHCSNGEDELNCTRTVRLVNGPSSSQGRLEVYYRGRWGTVCDDSFEDVDARVACYSMGYGYVGRTLGNIYGPGRGQIWLDDIECTGRETHLFNCRHSGWGSHNCYHDEDVSISCSSSTTSALNAQTVRLVNGSSSYEGRLEVYYNSTWGTVCDDGFSNVDARVACYSMGYGHVGQTLENRYGAGRGPIWLDNVACTGSETHLFNCRHSGWGSHNCEHNEDVSISCSNALNTQRVRLVNGSSSSQGRLEVYYNSTWGTVCDDSFEDVDAKVACYSMGYGFGVTLGNRYGAGTGQIWLDDVACTGSETHLFNCRHRGWGRHNCGHGEDVSISCSNDCGPGGILCNGRCLPTIQICDGVSHCPNGEDERNCSDRCYRNDRHCDNGWCLLTKAQCSSSSSCRYLNFWCDGYNDCPDQSDEAYCNRSSVYTTTTPATTTTPRPRCNGPGQFECANGWCISVLASCTFPWCQSWNFRCDGYRDCPDNSDEAGCTNVTRRDDCRPGEFKCNDGRTCISRSKWCNRRTDCPDGSDELHCPCQYSNQFRCGSGECIYNWYRCDGRIHCRDGSDEICNCTASQFRCNSGQCVTVRSICEGISYCVDGSDQANCSCGSNQFQCRTRRNCISQCKVCDGDYDCADGSDEYDCSCDAETQFRCGSGECKPLCTRCDGRRDCADSSDEFNCTCPSNTFQCVSNGMCIPTCQLCDGYSQCGDNSDEINCTRDNTCQYGYFRCVGGGSCLSPYRRCNGRCDCPYCTDELNCYTPSYPNITTPRYQTTTVRPSTTTTYYRACSSSYFHCGSGECVRRSNRCDGHCNCRDCSDERNCTCPSYRFQCDSGECIYQSYRCNGRCNCGDCSDERNCICPSYKFQCDSGECIYHSYRCNGYCNCRNCSDERNCTCPSHKFHCDSGECIYQSYQCNGYCNCRDCSDERNCTCPSNQFKCGSGECMPQSNRCNGRCNCRDCSDERNCTCAAIGARCANGRCLNASERCDGVNDCGDYSDETNCTYCPSYYNFRCRMGLCLRKSAYCNGTVECPDGSDEPPNCHRCRYGFACNNGRCISRYQRCDGVNQCGDFSDELSCTCPSNKYRCNMGLCVPLSTWCDGYRDCPDGSDEMPGCDATCPNTTASYGICKTGGCIYSSQICDTIQHCPDDSDEVNCTCRSHQYGCINGRCIYRDWMCDGVEDCPLGDDELPSMCNRCGSSQFHCSRGRSCINADQECDGYVNCNDTSDEAKCLSLAMANDSTSALSVKYRGVSGYYVCSSHWTSALSDAVCRQLGFGSASSTVYVSIAQLSNSSTLTLNGRAVSTRNILQLLQPGECSSQTVVGLTCMAAVCGRRSPNISVVSPYIINGQWAARGAWPWQIMLKLNGRFNCGGSVLNRRWILTAAHCLQSRYGQVYRPSQLQLRLGGILAKDPDPDAIYASISHVIPHPNYYIQSGLLLNDVGLLRLTSPITYTDTILPICLPSPNVNLDQFKVCVSTGYGYTSSYGPSASRLLQVKNNILPHETCRHLWHNHTSINETAHICVGSVPTRDRGTCYGDSGGPLACKDQQDKWTVIGVTSFGWPGVCHKAVDARVSTYVNWIQQTIRRYP